MCLLSRSEGAGGEVQFSLQLLLVRSSSNLGTIDQLSDDTCDHLQSQTVEDFILLFSNFWSAILVVFTIYYEYQLRYKLDKIYNKILHCQDLSDVLNRGVGVHLGLSVKLSHS